MSLIVTPSRDGRVQLDRDYTAEIVPGWSITVPAGFVTDGASIPRLAWRVVGPPIRGRYFRAAVVHDWMYHSGSAGSRVIADAVFMHMMRQDGVPFWRRAMIYLSVRCWGRYFYREES